MPSRDEALLAFYTSSENEAGRLALLRNRLEFVRTQELLRARLPAAPVRILDVGGGTGAHAAWLAGDDTTFTSSTSSPTTSAKRQTPRASSRGASRRPWGRAGA